jgi:hypothetical protein
MSGNEKVKVPRTEAARNNLYAVVCRIIISLVLIGAYAIETFGKNARSIVHFGVLVALGVVPVVVEVIIYKKNRDSLNYLL